MLTIHVRRGVLAVVSATLVVLSSAQADNRNLKVAKKPEAAADRRVALVIGNGNYASSPLRNPANDARAVSAALKELGFDVLHQENLGLKAMGKTIRDFGNRLKDSGGVGLFYYAGHGMQVKGRNFLIPVDADIQNEDEIAFNALDANIVLEKMETANNRLNLVILDACRNNPFARSFRSGSQGLAQMDAPGGTLIAFATAPGSVAADGDGSNGIYTKHLIANMKTPGLAVEQLFKKVRIGVMTDTKERQVPWESSSLKGDFYFKEAPEAQVAAVRPPSASELAQTIELSFWESIRTSRAIADYQAYLEQYPQGRFATLARSRVKQIGDEERERPAAVELSYWDSIKASRSVADFQSYLDQYPNGKFVALARNRLSDLKEQAAREPRTPPAPAAAASPTAVPKPPPAPVPASKSARLPNVGDSWTYQYIDGWNNSVKRRFGYQVTEVSPKLIRESISIDDTVTGEMAYRDEPMAVGTRPKGVEKTEFAPYLSAFVDLKEGDRWNQIDFKPDNSYGHPNLWKLKGRVLGEESVTVPAGKFKAIKVEVTGVRDTAINSRFAPTIIQHTLWYAPEIKRVVRQVSNSSTPSPQFQGDRDIYELIDYKPAGISPVSGSQLASAATPAQLAAALPAAYPRIGDSWSYRYVDGWKKETLATLTYRVANVSAAEIVERLEVNGAVKGTLRTGKQPRLNQRRLDNLAIVEFSPFLGAFGALDGKERWDSIEFSGDSFDRITTPWRLKAKVAGREAITVPAGRFDTVKVEVAGDRDWQGSLRTSAATVRHTLWYAPAIKRFVRQETLSRNEAYDEKDRIHLDLVNYSVASGP